LIMSEKKTIFLIFFLALLLRQSLAFLPGFLIDMNAWYAWSHRLAEFGLVDFTPLNSGQTTRRVTSIFYFF
jgi:hypothetical protein